MIIIKLAFALLFPTMLGYTIVSLIANKKDDLFPLERLAISYGIGIGALTFIMFLIGALLIPLNLINISFSCLMIFIYPAYFTLRKLSIPKLNLSNYLDQLKSFKWYEWLLITAISIRVFYSYFEALIKPVQECDAFANWSLRAKVFFVEQGLSLIKTHGYFFGGYHIFYPINIPLFETWIYNVLGTWNDLLVKIIFPNYLLLLCIIFYYGMRRYASRSISLFSTYLITSLPFLIYHSFSEYMDFPLAVYYFAAFIFLFNYINSNKMHHLYLSAIFAGICIWTKSEGLMLILSTNLLMLCIYQFINKRDEIRSALMPILYYFSLIFLFRIPWSIFNVYYGIEKNPFQKVDLSGIFSNLYRVQYILDIFTNKFFFCGNWNIAWFVFLVICIAALVKRVFNNNLYIHLFIFIDIIGLQLLYYFTQSYAFLLDGTSLNRNTLVFIPLVIYFIGYNMAIILGQDNK